MDRETGLKEDATARTLDMAGVAVALPPVGPRAALLAERTASSTLNRLLEILPLRSDSELERLFAHLSTILCGRMTRKVQGRTRKTTFFSTVIELSADCALPASMS